GPQAVAALGKFSAWERELLEIILLEPEAVPAAAEVVGPEQMHSPAGRIIFTRCCELSRAGVTPDFDRLLLEFDEPAIKAMLVDWDDKGRAKTFDSQGNMGPASDPAARLRDLLGMLRRGHQQQAIDEQARRLREQPMEADEQLALLEQLIEQERTRQ